ncbi:MAG: peptidoglycan-binding protein [Actinomycetia bacterium]|nr:peptidoglycan-binding protein [Actinomycetes bacterium]
MTRSGRVISSLFFGLLLLGAVSCSSDDSTDTSTTTTSKESSGSGGSSESAATARFDKEIQQELADVGCYDGQVDGILGSQSDAALLQFQKDAGLSADGELGPETEAALKKAVADGKTVCGSSASTTVTSAASTTTSSPDSGDPGCTAVDLVDALGGDPSTTLTNYACADGYAAGTEGDTKFILAMRDGNWVSLVGGLDPVSDPNPCESPESFTPPIPEIILQDGC